MSDKYRFTKAVDSFQTYSDGTEVPHRMMVIERQKPDGTWEGCGFLEVHLHRVIRNLEDIEDISVGITARINPKVHKA